MLEDPVTNDFFESITQVIGVAYTFRPSLAVRHYLTRDISADHSSKRGDFSYFFKGDKQSIGRHKEELLLRRDPVTNQLAKHWPEPELAILLGAKHQIISYTLANDLTAATIELRGRTADFDGTYFGKVWFRSGSVGPRFVSASEIGDASELLIGLRVIRKGQIVYDQSYLTSRRLRSFTEIPNAVISCFRSFEADPPPSKRITLENGFLAAGTLIMLGTGLIVQHKYFCEPGDGLTVYCPKIGELINPVAMPNSLVRTTHN